LSSEDYSGVNTGGSGDCIISGSCGLKAMVELIKGEYYSWITGAVECNCWITSYCKCHGWIYQLKVMAEFTAECHDCITCLTHPPVEYRSLILVCFSGLGHLR
jgi:hypothetical protein